MRAFGTVAVSVKADIALIGGPYCGASFKAMVAAEGAAPSGTVRCWLSTPRGRRMNREVCSPAIA